jgi:hypothetical protein
MGNHDSYSNRGFLNARVPVIQLSFILEGTVAGYRALRSRRQRSYEPKIPVGVAPQTQRVDKVVPPMPPVKASATAKAHCTVG